MNKQLQFGAAVLLSSTALTCTLGQPAMAGDTITISIVAAEAPNYFGAPGFSGWAANAITAVENNQTSAGTAGTPTYFQEVTSGTDTSNIVTNFPSWNGVAPPPTGYTSQLGNRLTYILVATDSSGANISLSELRGLMSSSDPANTFGFTYNWGNGKLSYSGGTYTSPTAYSADQIGIKNPGAGQTVIDSGLATQTVNELIVVGFGNALAASPLATCSTGGQAGINCVKAQYDKLMPFNITAKFSLVGPGSTLLASGSDSVPFPAPEPGTLALFGSAVAGLGLIGRRRKKA